jgi:long-subunit acyl-CoA synthetase (AMP-forming)
VRLSELVSSLQRHPEGVILSYEGGRPVQITFAQVAEEVGTLTAQLKSAGVGRGSVVGLAGPNNYRWLVADFALIQLGCVSICFPDEMVTELGYDRLGETYGLGVMLLTGPPPSPEVPGWCGVVGAPGPLAPGGARPCRSGWPEDVYSLVFSSGTTGTPKCLKLSRAGVENTVEQSAKAWKVVREDNILITMPFSNIQQRWMAYAAVANGFTLSIVPPEMMFRALKQLNPTIILGPPAFFEVVEKRFLARSLPYRAAAAVLDVLLRWLPPGLGVRLKRRTFREFHATYGARPRLLLVGSAPTRMAMLHVFRTLGLPLYQVYGMTEFGWISFNLPGQNRIGSVGRPLPGVRVEVGADGEVIVSGDRVQTAGYAFDSERFEKDVYLSATRVATGDTGSLGRGGYLFLAGRKKNVIITSAGLKLSPESVESQVEALGVVSRAVVYPRDNRPGLVCLAFVDGATDAARAAVLSAVAGLNTRLRPPERIAQVLVLPGGDLTARSGMVTANFKINRKVVWDNYRSLVEEGTREGIPVA